MTIIGNIESVAKHQVRNFIGLTKGETVTPIPHGSRTLGQDDVDIAFEWLKKSDQWSDETIVKQFEEKFAAWNGSKYAYAFSAGRVALSACINALGLEPGDEVLIPGYTCVVVPNAFEYVGIKPVYCDIELDTYGPDLDDYRRKISDRTRAVFIQHLYGLVCRDYEGLIRFARERDLLIIEDCCHSTGATFEDKKVGNRGNVSFYSTEQSKVMNTIMGGVAVTNDEKIAAGLRKYAACCKTPDNNRTTTLLMNVPLQYYKFKHKQRWWRGDLADFVYDRYKHVSTTAEEMEGIKPASYECVMAAPMAAIGLNQLSKVDEYNRQRRDAAKQWDEWCSLNGCPTPLVLPRSVPVFLRYPTRVAPEQKLDTRWAKQKLGVELGVWFVSNVHPATRSVDGCPNAGTAVSQCVNFPTILDD